MATPASQTSIVTSHKRVQARSHHSSTPAPSPGHRPNHTAKPAIAGRLVAQTRNVRRLGSFKGGSGEKGEGGAEAGQTDHGSPVSTATYDNERVVLSLTDVRKTLEKLSSASMDRPSSERSVASSCEGAPDRSNPLLESRLEPGSALRGIQKSSSATSERVC